MITTISIKHQVIMFVFKKNKLLKIIIRMYLDLKFNKNELSKIGILDIYIKRKLKYYFSKNFKNKNKSQNPIKNN